MKHTISHYIKQLPFSSLLTAIRTNKNSNQVEDPAETEYADEIAAFRSEKNLASTRNRNTVKVAFLTQYLPAWSKCQTLYEELKRDPRFEPEIICIPSDDSREAQEASESSNSTFDYFIANGYKAIDAYKDGEWLDLQSLDFDYVFYPRPYNHLLPSEFHSQAVSRYSKICIIQYGMEISEDFFPISFNDNFFRNVYCYLAETQSLADRNASNYAYLHAKGYMHSEYLGVPAFTAVFAAQKQDSPSWQFSTSDNYRIIWAPRWTTDKTLGGSNFFTYKDLLFDYADKNSDVDILFRPHPLTLGNFINTGELSEADLNRFYQQIETAPNISLDDTAEYFATFWKSDALLTDISSIIPEYFIMGKPIILCMNNMELKLLDYFSEITSACYLAYTEEDVVNTINDLKTGNDPLKGKRLNVRDKIFGSDMDNTEKKIADWLYQHK